MQVGMEFGWLLARFWVDFGRQAAPKSVQDGLEIDIKTWSKK